MQIRAELPQDISSISHLLKQAFANHPYSNNNEYLLVENLRKEHLLTLSLVALIDKEIVGYIAFSPITINDKPCNWLGLAPLAVLPKNQKQGIGKALIKESLTQLKALNIDGCVVIGDPEYYPRMGFKPASPLVYTDVEEKYFMKLVFKEQPTQSGEVKFHPIFDDGSH